MKYLVIFFALFGFLIMPAFAQDSCDINNEIEIKKKLDQDPVVNQFLERHPSAIFTHHKTFDEPGNPHTFSEFVSDGLRLKIIVSKYDDERNCYRIGGYSTEYDFPNSGTGSSTKIDQFEAEQWKDAMTAVNDLTNPHKQMKMGIPIYAIKCKEGLYPIPKVDRITPACVTDDANSKLLMRGWTPLRIGMPAETNIMISYGAAMLYPFKATKDFDPRSPYFSTVYWVNNDVVSHTIVAKDGSWRTDEIKPGKIGSMSFNNTGIYRYFVAEKPATEGIVMFERFIDFDSDEETFFPKQIAIKKIQDEIVSESSYDELRQIIQNQVDQNDLEQFSSVFLKDMRQEFNKGEKILFTLVNFGYRDWCLMPAISVYHEDYIMPIYEDEIVHTCPAPMENPTPRISLFDEQDFRTFPSCQFEGKYIIWGESFEFGPQAIGSFYCNSSEKFNAPETFEITIPQGSSNSENNFIPSELELRFGDYVKIINQDDYLHYVILFVDKQAGTAVFGIRVSPGESFTEPVYHLGTFELASWDENEKEYPWMHGVVTVTED